jgi:hypothetical protein
MFRCAEEPVREGRFFALIPIQWEGSLGHPFLKIAYL